MNIHALLHFNGHLPFATLFSFTVSFFVLYNKRNWNILAIEVLTAYMLIFKFLRSKLGKLLQIDANEIEMKKKLKFPDSAPSYKV